VANENDIIKGYKFSAVAAGIKKASSARLDFALIVSDTPAVSAAVTTSNLVRAAPVEITRERLTGGLCQAILMNSGNANCFTGDRGLKDASDLTSRVAEGLGIDSNLVVPMSTGVIGNPLPIDRMSARIPELISRLDGRSFMEVAAAIMTTDTVPKTVLLQGSVTGGPFTMLGFSKGAGMIAPNMATMLAVILTDLRVELDFLKECLQEAVAKSFNAITIDGDTSTNDTAIVMTGGRIDALELSGNLSDREAFSSLLNKACEHLARQIVLDGEGATKLIRISVCGAPDVAAATKVARKIAESPLVKTAFHGEDPNWGRIVCSAGNSGVIFDPSVIDLSIGEIHILENGKLTERDWESAAHNIMKGREFSVLLDLKSGNGEASLLTTDFSEEYVTINADYRS
jgi:glutamate N-acetyltransferase / amino-acid N-acetyltransferase